MNYVIIGNSAGGIAAIEGIRECDKQGKITVISDEAQFNYSRPLISYLLGRKINLQDITYRGKDFYEEHKVELILNKKAVKLDVKDKQVILSGRKRVFFDKLLIAVGGTPFIPEIRGLNAGGVFTFTKLSDVEKIEKYIKANKVKKAVVIGGGLIGLKAAEALLALKIKVTIVELVDRILSATFDKRASNIIENALGKTGCEIITNNTVVEIKGKDKKVKQVLLKNKQKIPAEIVITAIGVRPNIALVKNTPIKTKRGILVNDFMETNIKNIYAAGDCCEAKDALLNTNRSIAIWPAAVRQGKIAGFNMALHRHTKLSGAKKEYQGSFAMNSIELGGIPTISVGQTCFAGKGYQVLEHFDEAKFVYKKIVLKNERIIGAIFTGDIERAGIYTGLIKDKVDVTGFKDYLLKEDFGLINLPKEYRKHLVTEEVPII